MRFQLSIIIIVGMICAITTQSTSIYKGVTWHKLGKKWYAQLWIKGEKTKYGGYFNDELDAAKRVNQLCEEFGYPAQNPGISAIPNQQSQKKQKTSQYKGVCLNKKTGKWCVQLAVKGEKKRTGGYFNDELDAAKKVNQLCEELEIPTQNPTISAIPNQQKEKTSKHKGVSWDKQVGKWHVFVYLKGHIQKYGGVFKDELDAAKRVNQLCEEWGIPQQNPTISAIPNEQYQAKGKTSQYTGVHWRKKKKKWVAKLRLKGQGQKHGGQFNHELDAAKKVNQLCIEFGIPEKNPGINGIPNQQYQVQHDDFQTIENPAICTEILNTDDDDGNNKKRKRKKEFNDDDKLPVERNYFYDYLLK